MPSSYFTMWGTLLIMTLGTVAGPLIHSHVLSPIRAAYPANAAKRDALRRCGEIDGEFWRFFRA